MEQSFVGISVGVVNSRNNEYFNACINSISKQIYPPEKMDLVIIDNTNKENSIGKCYNAVADVAKNEWVLYVGDDDFIVKTYLFNLNAILISHYDSYGYMPDALLTNLILFDKEKRIGIDATPTGLWHKDYLLKHKFNETLERYVDAEYYERANEVKAKILYDRSNYGYYYRQHTNNVSGNKFERKSKINNMLEKKIENNLVYGIALW